MLACRLGPEVIPEAIKVYAALQAHGLEHGRTNQHVDRAQKTQQIEAHLRAILQLLDLDLTDDSLSGTPRRVAKLYLEELFVGLDYANFPEITLYANKMQIDEMVMVRDITLVTTCEHHLVTIDGKATVAYLPQSCVIGLSKINRIVQFFARRPQIQERLTRQILVALQTLLGTDNVAVMVDAVHYCVKARGICDTNSSTTTTALGGVFKSCAITRQEFLNTGRPTLK